jgi:hypothetical protein
MPVGIVVRVPTSGRGIRAYVFRKVSGKAVCRESPGGVFYFLIEYISLEGARRSAPEGDKRGPA